MSWLVYTTHCLRDGARVTATSRRRPGRPVDSEAEPRAPVLCRAKAEQQKQEAGSLSSEAAAAEHVASTTQPKDPGKRPNGVAPSRAEHKQPASHRSSEPEAAASGPGKKGGPVCQACHKHHRSAFKGP